MSESPEVVPTEVVVPAETVAGTAKDARNRAVRTFLQNLAVDVVVALLLVIYPVVSGAQDLSQVQWGLLAASVLKTLVVTVLSFLMRFFKLSPKTTTV